LASQVITEEACKILSNGSVHQQLRPDDWPEGDDICDKHHQL
jgi:hypothetical protein